MAKRRGRETARDMLLSLGVCLVVVGAVVAVQEVRPDDPVREVDPTSDLALVERAAGYDPLVPTGLPEGWRPTASRVALPDATGGPVRLTVGWLTPREEYAALVEADEPREALLDEVLGGAREDVGTVDVAGVPWERLRYRDDELALVRGTADGATVVVHGTASLTELRTLAAALR